MNIGMGDATNLGWKLAANLDGWAGPGLIDSYDRERRPVAQRFVAEATANMSSDSTWSARGSPVTTEDGRCARERLREDILTNKTKHFVSDGLVLGYRYDPRRSSCRTERRRPRTRLALHPDQPSGLARAARMAVRNKIDHRLFGKGFVLLRFGGAADDTGASPLRQRCERCRSRWSTWRARTSRSLVRAQVWSWCGPTVTWPGAATSFTA